MNKELSNKITIINFIMTIVIVLLHALIKTDNNVSILPFLYNIIRTIGDMAVPMFFVISSFLFFRNKANCFKKIKKRIKSLLIPYFIWSGLFYLIYLIMSYIPMIRIHLNNNIVRFSINNMINSIIFCKYIPQFWYIRILFFIIIFSCIYESIMRKNMKVLSFIIPIILFGINYYFNFSSTINIITWIPLFFIVGWITYFYEYNVKALLLKKNILISFVSIFITLFLVCFVSKFDIYSRLYYTWRMISPMCIFFILSGFKFKSDCNIIYKQSFYIFALHYFLINIIRNTLFIYIKNDTIGVIIVYFVSVIGSVLISLICSYLMQKYFSKVSKIITGDRGG